MAETSLARKLRGLEERYRHELMGEEERLKLLARIRRLRKEVAVTAARG